MQNKIAAREWFYPSRFFFKAIERVYIIYGILKNWAAEGYPKEGEESVNRSTLKNIGVGSNEFAGFKAKEPRTIRTEERAAIEIELL